MNPVDGADNAELLGAAAAEAGVRVTADSDVADLSVDRLRQADALVRDAGARAENGQLILAFDTHGAVRVDIPLPPEPLVPRLLMPRDLLTEAFQDQVLALLQPVLPGALIPGPNDELVVTWRPGRPDLEIEAVSRARAAGEHLALLAADAREGLAPHQSLERLRERLDQHRIRADWLSQTFYEHALARLRGIGVVHVLAYQPAPDPDDDPWLLALQVDADLWSPATGRGFYVSLRLPNPPASIEELTQRLVEVALQRSGLALQPSTDFEVLGEWGDLSDVCLLSGAGQSQFSFASFLQAVADQVRFYRSLLDFSRRGIAVLDRLAAGAPRVNAPKSRTRHRATPGEEQTPSGSPAPEAQPSPDELSAREVVKRLGFQEAADCQVFLTHAGYNPQKVGDVMALALSIPRDKAREMAENAPCLIAGPVTRARAAQIKTILEGTGAKIRVDVGS